MGKFTVGDIIRGTSVSIYNDLNTRMTRAIVTSTDLGGKPNRMQLRVVEHTNNDFIGKKFDVGVRMFELIPAPKFKVGDIIAGNADTPYAFTNVHMTSAKVLKVISLTEVHIEVLSNDLYESEVGCKYYVSPKFFDLVPPVAPRTLQVGDIVAGTENDEYLWTDEDMLQAKVTKVYANGNIDLLVLKNEEYESTVGKTYTDLEQKYFTLVEKAPVVPKAKRAPRTMGKTTAPTVFPMIKDCISVETDGEITFITIGEKHTIAVPTVAFAIASKCPTDIFDADEGKALASLRLIMKLATGAKHE